MGNWPPLFLGCICYLIILLPTALGAAVTNADDFDPLKYVDPLIGTVGGGNTFPGATVPYGMAKPGADTDSPDNQGGFVFDRSNVTGFSSLHDSGTGGSPSLGLFPIFTHAECPGDDLDRCVFPKKERRVHFINSSVAATPGYFGITLVNKVSVDMTATHHTSLFRLTYPAKSGQSSGPVVFLDLTDLSDSRQDNGTISVDPKTGRMTGGARFSPSFASGSYRAYFCADFKGGEILDTGIFVNSRATPAVKTLTISRSINGYPLPGGAFVRFHPVGNKPVLVRVGVSFISSERACQSAEKEIPAYDFNSVKAAAESLWREKLSPVRVVMDKVNSTWVKNFYSGMYRTMISPQDYTGENQLWTSDEPYFDSFYCLWDSFRSQIPFLTILDPHPVARMVRSLIDTYVHEGWMPDCRMSFNRGFTQGGSNADVILADAFAKGITLGIDWNKGYQAVVKDAEVEPFDWCCHGRGGLDSWKTLGYIPVQDFDYKGFGTMTRSISRTLEYSYNDFVISEIAKKLGGRDADVDKYVQRSSNWQNLFKLDMKSSINKTNTGFTGFFQPRYLNRTWGHQDPLKCSHIDTSKSVCSLQNNGAETFESSIWEYGFFVPHDHGSLIGLYGGPDNFVKRLNYLHDKKIGDIGNEPAFLTVFQYHYAGRPGLSAKRSHAYIPKSFAPTKSGLPGNDDSGAMGSFVAFNMMGLFPNPGQNVYLIIPPYFSSVSITSPATGKTATISVENFDPTYRAIYIQNATLDGRAYRRNWIGHEFFTGGGELVLRVGLNESAWGTRVEDLPPSLGPYVGFNGSAAFARPAVVDVRGLGMRGGDEVPIGGRPRRVRYGGERDGLGVEGGYWGAVGVV